MQVGQETTTKTNLAAAAGDRLKFFFFWFTEDSLGFFLGGEASVEGLRQDLVPGNAAACVE
jgi:hypothetical protein